MCRITFLKIQSSRGNLKTASVGNDHLFQGLSSVSVKFIIIIGLLYQLWREKSSSETEITLQLIVCFHRFFLSEASREEAMYSTRIVSDIIECLSHKNSHVRKAADDILEFVLEQDRQENGELGRLGAQIKKKRFESFNRQYLIETTNMEHEVDMYGEDSSSYNHFSYMGRYGNDDLELDGSLDWRPTLGGRNSHDDDDDMDDSYGEINRWKRDRSEGKSSALYGRDYDDPEYGNYGIEPGRGNSGIRPQRMQKFGQALEAAAAYKQKKAAEKL